MYIRFILYTFGLLAIQSVNAQKHHISIFAAPQITKTNFSPSQLTTALYGYAQPNKPLIGHSYGFAYAYQPNKKYALSLAFKNNHSGQQSPLIYDYYGGGSYPDGFGGFRSQVLYWSTSLELGYDYYFANTSKRRSAITFGLGLDFARRHFAQEISVGRKVISMNSSVRYGSTDGDYFRVLQFSIKESLYRYRVNVGLKNEFKIYKDLYLLVQPEFTFLPPMIRVYVLNESLSSGSIFLFGMNTGVSFKF